MKHEFINIGDFNEAITWKAPTAAKDSTGQTIRSFADYKTDWAAVGRVSVSEGEISNRLQYAETRTFTTHYDANINNNYQILFNGDEYNIIGYPEYINIKIFMRVTAQKIVE